LDVELESAAFASKDDFISPGLEGQSHMFGFRSHGLSIEDGAEGAATIPNNQL
jgi:hypothetical protein